MNFLCGGGEAYIILISKVGDISKRLTGLEQTLTLLPSLMTPDRFFPSYLTFDTKIISFEFEWINPAHLRVEAIRKEEPTKCYRTEKKGEDKKTMEQIRKLYEYMEAKTAISELHKMDLLTSVITVVSTGEDKLRVLVMKEGGHTEILQLDMTTYTVPETYLLQKKIERFENDKRTNKAEIMTMKYELQKVFEEKDQDLQDSFRNQIGALVTSVEDRIKMALEAGIKQKHKKEEGRDSGSDSEDEKKKLKKEVKKLKKKLKKQEKSKRKHRKEKKRRRKEKRKEKRSSQQERKDGEIKSISSDVEIVEGQALKQPESIEVVDTDIQQIKPEIEAIEIPIDLVDIVEIFDQPEGQAVEKIKKKKKEKSRHKDRHRQKEDKPQEEAPRVVPLQSTGIPTMSKLRSRDPLQSLRQIKAHINVEDIAPQQPLLPKKKSTKKQKRNRSDKKRKEQLKPKPNADFEVIEIDEKEKQKVFNHRLEEIRRQKELKDDRVKNINKYGMMFKKKEEPLPPPILEPDQFNPNYNGIPKYKNFVSINEYEHKRVGDIFVGKLNEPGSQCKKIPAVFIESTPTYKYFEINGNIVRKIGGGSGYKQLVFDYPLPKRGKHISVMRIIVSKHSYIWFGILDIRQKDRQESFNKKSCIAFSFKTGHVVTSNKWGKQKLGRMGEGVSIRMQIDMDRNTISWHTSTDQCNIAPINKLMQKCTLVPYFQMMTNDDEVCFQYE